MNPDQPQPNLDYPEVLECIGKGLEPLLGKGQVATYIPALAEVDPHKFGISLRTIEGREYGWGDYLEPFSIQSISKVFTLTLAMQLEDELIWDRVGREPSGNPFNSLVQLEYEKGKPRNPFINAGALVLTDIVLAYRPDAKAQTLSFVRELAGNDRIDYDARVAASERSAGHRNFALAHFLKSYGNITGDVDTVLDTYFHFCALSMTCLDLCRAFSYLANGGISPITGQRVITARQTKRINALMLTCGLYDESGDLAYRVGIPGKSGVGGGIVGVLPGNLCITTWGPALNANHNSLCGMKALEWFTTMTERSIF